MTAAILRLKVTLNDVEPKVLRRIEVPADIKLDRLHLTLQAALGWTNVTLRRRPRVMWLAASWRRAFWPSV